MKCPRCGFTQPRDQYCAQCGLDISNYKPPKLSLFDRLTRNPLLQLAFVGLIIFFVASTIIKKKNPSVSDRVSYLKGNLQISSQKPNSTTFSESPAQEVQIADSAPPSANLADNTNSAGQLPPVQQKSNDSTATLSASTKSSGTPDAKSHHVVKISYYEMNKRVRQMMFDESQNTGQFNFFNEDYYAGLLTQFQHKLKSFGNQAVLLHSEVKNIDDNKTISWFHGLESSNTENHIGFRYTLDMSEPDPGQFRLNFEILKSWKEGVGVNASIEKTSFPMQIEMQKSSAAFIGGVLTPPPTNQENDDYISSIPPFSILKSRIFRGNQSQLVIIIEIEK